MGWMMTVLEATTIQDISVAPLSWPGCEGVPTLSHCFNKQLMQIKTARRETSRRGKHNAIPKAPPRSSCLAARSRPLVLGRCCAVYYSSSSSILYSRVAVLTHLFHFGSRAHVVPNTSSAKE